MRRRFVDCCCGFCGGVSECVSGLLVLDLAFSLGFVVICVWRLGALFCGLFMVCLSCWFFVHGDDCGCLLFACRSYSD